MSTVPRRVADFCGEFEFWPLEADPEALTIAEHRPPGYFECDDIFVPSSRALVEQGLQRGVAEWKEWEARHPEQHLFRLQRHLRLPDNFQLLPPDDDEEEEEEEGGGQTQKKRKQPPVGGAEEDSRMKEEDEEGEKEGGASSAAAAAASSASAPAASSAAASASSQPPQQQQQQQDEDEDNTATARGKAGAAVGGHPGLPPPPPPPPLLSGRGSWERRLAAAIGEGGGGGEGGAPPQLQLRPVERAAQLGPDAATLRGLLRHMPNHAAAHRALKARMRDSRLALCKWKKACEGGGAQTDPSAMKDYKTLPFLRRAVNVIAVPDRVATAEEAGPFALGEEEPLVVVSMFVPQNWALLHYQDYTLLARNFLQQLHMVMYCTMSSVLAVEARAGHLPRELTRPNLAFFFIEGAFYVADRHGAGEEEEGEGQEQEQEQPPDYLDSIIEWLDDPQQERRAQLGIPPHGPIEIKNMADVTLGELTLRLGTRYLYCHLGDCEHAFIISDLRLPGPEDDRDARLYPMLTYQKHYRKRRCVICDARPGQYVAIRDPLGDETRGVYCEFCHFQLHYDKDGHLLHDDGFEVFPYLHDD